MPPTPIETILASETVGLEGLSPSELVGDVRRVALFAEAFLPKVDGVTRTALLTIKYLQQTGREVIVFAPAPALPQIGNTQVVGVPSLWLPFYSETRVAPPWPFLLPRLRRFKPDVIHLFSPFSLGLMGMLAGGLLKVPVIANYQTDLPAYTRTYGFGAVHSSFVRLLRYLHNGCHLTLSPSRSALEDLECWGIRRTRLWERGIDTVRFTPAKRDLQWRERLLSGRDPNNLIVLYVGRMAKDKHLETLREVARLPGVTLVLIGGGADQPGISNALPDAQFIGTLYGDDLAHAYAAADVFVFPGPEETFGQVVLEAMASGLPPIVTNRGGPASYIIDGENGYICPVDDGRAFAERVVTLRNHPDWRAKMAHQARIYAEHHPWIAVMRQLETYYDEALRLDRRLRSR